jgi:hypothetical protein
MADASCGIANPDLSRGCPKPPQCWNRLNGKLDQELPAPKCLERGLANRAWRLYHGPFGNHLGYPSAWVFPTAAACTHCVARSALVHTSRASSGAYLSFDIKPLIDLDISFAMGRDRLPA